MGAGGAGLLGGVLLGMSLGCAPRGCPPLQLWLPGKVGGCCLLIWSPGACREGGLGGISGKPITCAEKNTNLHVFPLQTTHYTRCNASEDLREVSEPQSRKYCLQHQYGLCMSGRCWLDGLGQLGIMRQKWQSREQSKSRHQCDICK